MKLAEQQQALFALVTGQDAAHKPHALVNGGSLNPAARVDVYSEMYVLRTRDTLREDFPLLAKVLGEKKFNALVRDYIAANHSTHYSLARLGQFLPEYLKENRLSGARKDLADLAALEWTRGEAFLDLDGPVLTSLQGVDQSTFASARLQLHPSVHVLELDFDVIPFFRSLDKVEVREPKENKTPTAVVIWRKEFEVFHVKIDAAEAKALRAALAGETVETICESFAGRDDAAAAAFQAIGSWLTEGMISKVL